MDRKLSGDSREGMNGLMCLKFGTLIAWVNSWEGFFNFLKILIFRSYLGGFFGLKFGQKLSGCTMECMDDLISYFLCLEFIF